MKKINIDINGKTLEISTGELAKQAAGSAVVRYGDTVVLATVTFDNSTAETADFLPLMVDYRERTYAAGKIPGGFFKREGRPREKETLTSRIVDRTIRPLFPEGYNWKTQVNLTLLSSDLENDSDILSVIGASAALGLSEIPFTTPVAAVRVGRIDGKFVLNPTVSERENADIDVFISATDKGVVMLEGCVDEADEDSVMSAIEHGMGYMNKLLEFQKQLFNANKLPLAGKQTDETVVSEVYKNFEQKIKEAVRTNDKKTRENLFVEIKKQSAEMFPEKTSDAAKVIEEITEKSLREMIVTDKIRSDGRKFNEIRPITCKIGVLPRTHGSALFTRGQTQALATVTLGTPHDMQIMDELAGEYKKRFMLHYNFPAFATGEVRPERGPGRREIGHGALAEKSLEKVLPNEDSFPYAIRVVSDILESNGSSSMATVCGGSLAMMDAGIPIKSAVAGIAMGLIKNGSNYIILTDIQGLEDHFGDMDFKVAGTTKGITGIQMDIKIDSVELKILKELFAESRVARLKILDIMNTAISTPKNMISDYAPRIALITIPVTKIKDVIGSGGKNIKKIMAETNAELDVEDDGKIFISAESEKSLELAKQMVEYYTADVEVGKLYKGKVVSIMNFGAFVEILPGQDGLVHISQLEDKRVEKVDDVVSVGDEIWVKVMEIDKQGRINLSKKQAAKEMAKKQEIS
ncbi:MAG: Polyribonucleotide nucleotidyltransferase [Elusimicrobia bacterium ADurb.Bin231]|nr:MAG: Polyribonucleotide nucleotidyltransferase [Elusimicrobia bacterium ADurb.Bin231]